MLVYVSEIETDKQTPSMICISRRTFDNADVVCVSFATTVDELSTIRQQKMINRITKVDKQIKLLKDLVCTYFIVSSVSKIWFHLRGNTFLKSHLNYINFQC